MYDFLFDDISNFWPTVYETFGFKICMILILTFRIVKVKRKYTNRNPKGISYALAIAMLVLSVTVYEILNQNLHDLDFDL